MSRVGGVGANGTDGVGADASREKPATEMQNMSGIGGISEIEYDQ